MIDDPVVSVVMPTYRDERFIGESIGSILDQSYEDFEFIIVSDVGSSESSRELIDSYSDRRIRHIRKESNPGISHSLNLGIGMARGEFIAIMNDDDFSMRDRISKEIEFLRRNPRVGIVGTGIEVIYEETGESRVFKAYTEPGLNRWILLFNSCIANPSLMMRRSVFDAAGGYDPAYVAAQDYEFFARAIKFTEAANLPDILVRLRKHRLAISTAQGGIQFRGAMAVSRSAITELLGHPVPEEPFSLLFNPGARGSPEVLAKALDLLLEIYRAYTRKNSPSRSEIEWIERDLIKRMCSLAVRGLDLNFLTSLKILTEAMRVNLRAFQSVGVFTAEFIVERLTGKQF